MTVRVDQRDRGETLVELIITMVIMGLTIPAIVGAILLATDSSTQDRKQAQAQQLLASWSETVTAATTDGSYAACSVPDYTSGSYGPGTLPTGFAASVVDVTYWQRGTATSAGSFAAAASPCNDHGLRRVRLRISVAAGLYPGFATDRYVLLRRPCVGSGCP